LAIDYATQQSCPEFSLHWELNALAVWTAFCWGCWRAMEDCVSTERWYTKTAVLICSLRPVVTSRLF